ncbi:type II pantothenate kinase [Oceanobacillus zhaokaii]|uniref:Type II pantothenate kinase n=1 Tax=Oceanobacillus zhaokaii TaxID=2052660 RepID=A0A345PJS3_9BACI|nr:type II pantothenate kinase [Oceanobacillus zhaokaii]AXI10253.1 type II pantothenate kinase [Oceanobacillus zhaokaii]
MVEKVGIDAGGSLIKVAYEDNNEFVFKTFSQMDSLLEWLNSISLGAELYLTGGKSGYLQDVVKQKSHLKEEFQAIIDGTRLLLEKEHRGIPDSYLITSIGTGTSVFHVAGETHNRLLGSGIGGGTLMGLGKLLTGEVEFQSIISLAENGNRQNSDLLVKDIYTPSHAPLLGELTAANFGKAHLNEHATTGDHIASLIQLIGETIISLAGQAAVATGTEKIVFVGSTLNGNKPLKKVLGSFQEMMPYEPLYLEKGAYVGAIGSLV